MGDFFININEDSFYPSSKCNFNPDTEYPEYNWGGSAISSEKNPIYEMVRECLIGLNMDSHNFNKPEWNPFCDLIHEGDTVLIKPNWVMHFNKNTKIVENSLECLITHPAIVRAIADYCLIALKGTGQIIIGDAPMQFCDLDKLLEFSGYRELFSFYNQRSINIYPTDFRQYAALFDNNKVIIGKKHNINNALEVELGLKSKLSSNKTLNKRYKVSDYDDRLTNAFHNNDRHTYVINKTVLSADVVINLPKPKCHRLAGITGSLKNFVGITYNKASLPHRTVGSIQQGGDEYLHNSLVKEIIGKILDKKIDFENSDKYLFASSMRYIYGLLYYLMKFISKDKYLIGSWYGNDTIWRTTFDLYHILLYANKSGKVLGNRQRRVFNVADMIISGERNGPVGPEPKKLGVIIAGYDGVMMDRLICEIMGFDYSKVPSVFHSVHDLEIIEKDPSKYLFYSNVEEYHERHIDDLHFPNEWRFKPHDSWKGAIEKT